MNDSITPLEESLIRALKAIENQIARELQRSPAETAEHGISKSAPFDRRVELLTSFLLNELGANSIQLDGVIVLARTFAKTLLLAAQDLGSEGLGKVRTAYLRETFEALERDSTEGMVALGEQPELS